MQIRIKDIDLSEPYSEFVRRLNEAIDNSQQNVEAMCISSFNKDTGEVDSRYVNLKVIEKKQFIFFSNYLSPKAIQFRSFNKVAISIFWNSTNTQIRMQGEIKKYSDNENNAYFKERDIRKNALAISSQQSEKIDSYNSVLENYKKTLSQNDLTIRPKYWGGYCFQPYKFEFWTGEKNRLNKRIRYYLENKTWKSDLLQP